MGAAYPSPIISFHCEDWVIDQVKAKQRRTKVKRKEDRHARTVWLHVRDLLQVYFLFDSENFALLCESFGVCSGCLRYHIWKSLGRAYFHRAAAALSCMIIGQVVSWKRAAYVH